MERAFKHPLARRATTAKVKRGRGEDETVLVIVTTLELEAQAKGFNAKNFDRLHDAAKAFVKDAKDLAGYTIINRPKDWDA